LFLLSIKEGIFIANVLVSDTNGKLMQIFFSLLMAVSTPIIFQGLLEFVIMIRNPFGKDWVDLPVQLIHQQIRNEMFQYMGAGERAAAIPSVKAARLK
jgi:predicted membrane chloride channel (bestrophin family)